MKKAMLSILVVTGVLFAQSNNVSNNTINTNGGNLTISQSNNQISEEEIIINKKIDEEIDNLQFSDLLANDKYYLLSLLDQAKEINKSNISVEQKKARCNFKIEGSATVLKAATIKLAFTYCNKIF